MRLRHQLAQVQPQAHATGGALAGGIGPVEGLGQMGQLVVRHAGAVVTHRDAQATAFGAQVNFGRVRRVHAVAQRVVEQVAQQQAHAGAVQRQRGQVAGRRQLHGGGTFQAGDDLAGQGGQVHRLAVQRGVRAGQALALQQVGDQVAHVAQVAQQGVARGLHIGGFGQQLGVQAGAGQRAAQLVADGQQQGALGVEHLADVATHGVDGGSQLAQFVGPGRVAHGDRLRKVARAEAQGACADVVQRAQQAAHAQVGQPGEQQQHGQRGPADHAGLVLPDLHVQRKVDAVAVGGGALQQAGLVALPAVGLVPAALLIRRSRGGCAS
jgi:hypothetical protein